MILQSVQLIVRELIFHTAAICMKHQFPCLEIILGGTFLQ